jgi:glycosyltransferase involved in cell wall biosynthesis
MKILGICSGAYFFGKEAVTVNVLKGMKQRGYPVSVLFSGWHDGVFEKKLTEAGIESKPLKLGWYYLSKPLWTLDSLVHFPGALWRFLKLQRKFRPDIIYVDSYRPVILLAPFLKGKVIYHVHDPHTDTRADRLMLKLANKTVDLFIVVSDFIKKDLISLGIDPKKISVVHNGISIPEVAEEKKYLNKGRMRIGIIGQVIPRKGHEDLILACSKLKAEVPFDLFIYGGGEASYLQQLKQQISELGIEESVHWMGYESNKNAIYEHLDVIVAPTRNEEPFALVALESSAFKVPVIASASGGFPESIKDQLTGYIVPKSSPDKIAERLRNLFYEPEKFVGLGRNARINIQENFTSELMHCKLDGIFTSVSS